MNRLVKRFSRGRLRIKRKLFMLLVIDAKYLGLGEAKRCSEVLKSSNGGKPQRGEGLFLIGGS